VFIHHLTGALYGHFYENTKFYIGFGEKACGFNRGMKWETKRAMSSNRWKR